MKKLLTNKIFWLVVVIIIGGASFLIVKNHNKSTTLADTTTGSSSATDTNTTQSSTSGSQTSTTPKSKSSSSKSSSKSTGGTSNSSSTTTTTATTSKSTTTTSKPHTTTPKPVVFKVISITARNSSWPNEGVPYTFPVGASISGTGSGTESYTFHFSDGSSKSGIVSLNNGGSVNSTWTLNKCVGGTYYITLSGAGGSLTSNTASVTWTGC